MRYSLVYGWSQIVQIYKMQLVLLFVTVDFLERGAEDFEDNNAKAIVAKSFINMVEMEVSFQVKGGGDAI